MKKFELEQMLMNAHGLKTLGEQAELVKSRVGDHGPTAGAESERVRMLPQLPHDERETPAEVLANDRDFATRSDFAPDLSQFIPDFRKADPKALLRTLTQKLAEDPSAENQLFVEDAINKVTATTLLDAEDERMIRDAIKSLEDVN